MCFDPFLSVSVLPVSGCLAVSTITTTTNSSSFSVTTTDRTTGPPAAPTANQQDGAVLASLAARRRYDANKVVITIGGERLKDLPPPTPLTPDWEKRLTAGRKAIEEQARLMQQTLTTTVPVPGLPGLPGLMVDDRLPPRKTNLQRSKIVQTLSIPSESAAAGDGQPKRISALKALQRLKSTLSTPSLDETAVQRLDILNGGSIVSQANGKKRNSLVRRRSSSGADETDASVMSSYQPLEVDLDDDAIMV